MQQGRWMRPDPAGVAAVDSSNPQTWNRYAYVTNNPVSFTDPTGLEEMAPVDGGAGGGGCGGGSVDDSGGGGDDGGGGDGGDSADTLRGFMHRARAYRIGSNYAYHMGRTHIYGTTRRYRRPRAHRYGMNGPQASAAASGPGSSCGWLCGWLANSSLWGGGYQNNFNNDQAIFNIAQNAIFSYSPSSSLDFDGFSQIYTLEQENLTIDAVALGNESLSSLDNLPGIDLLPPGIGNAEDAGIDYFETVRDQNIGQIDQILQGMAPAAPSTPTGGGCQ